MNARLFLKLQNVNPQIEKEMIEYIKNLNSVSWFGSQEGKWD